MFRKQKIVEGAENVVLLSCGAFSPPTSMHMRMMEMAKEFIESQEKVHVALGVLSPVHDSYQKPGLEKSTHRMKMTELACEKSSWIEAWDWECIQPSWTRTRLVLEQLEEVTNCRVMICAGADFLQSLTLTDIWSIEDVAFLCRRGLLIVQRSDIDIYELILSNDTLFNNRLKIHLIPQPIINEVSSTKIRLLISRGLSVNFLIDDKVADYIHNHKLYSK